MTEAPVMEFRDVHKHFAPRAGIEQLFAGHDRAVRAVDGVSLRLHRGQVFGVAGESGSGKSTIANLLVGLERPTAGEILFDGGSTAKLGGSALRDFRRRVQMVFQDPFGSLDPRFTVRRSVEEPLVIHGIGSADDRRARCIAALEEAELRPGIAFLDRFPHELSGGQRQRVAIARAIVLDPILLIADEPVSMLDVSVRAGILRLLRRLVDDHGMAMVFITHDLSLIGQTCDELAIMYRGKLVEFGAASAVLRSPRHPYTRQLIAAVPVPDPRHRRTRLSAKLVAEAGRTYRGQGCRFSPRCDFATARCDERDPEPRAIGDRHEAACLRVDEIAAVST